MADHDAATLEALEKAKILDQLHDNLETRPLLFQGIKKIRPEARIPEVDTVDQVLTAIKPHVEAIGKDKAAMQEELQTLRAERTRDKAQRELGLSNEDFDAVTKLATEKKIGDLATAAEHWRLTREVAEPRSGPDTTIQLPNIKELWINPKKFSHDEAGRVFREFDVLRKQGRR